MSKFLSFIHFRNHLVCFGIEPKELFGQTVDEARERPSIGDCLFVRNVKVKVVPMNRFIARQAASIRQFFHAGAEVETVNFLEKIVAGGSSLNRQFFQASPKESTGGSGRKVGDALSFAKDRCNRFREVFGGLNRCPVRINKFLVLPQSDFSAVSTNFDKKCFRFKKLEKICRKYFCMPLRKHSGQIKAFSPFVQQRDQLINKLAIEAAMRAGKSI